MTPDVDLPKPPNNRVLNGFVSSPKNEATFNRQYARYSHVPYFDEARKAFVHKRLTNTATTGANTWHEQLIAGRVTPEDMKTLGYTNLAKFRTHTFEILDLVANGGMDSKTMRAAFDAAKKSRVHYRSDKTSNIGARDLQFCIRVAEWFGAEGVLAFEHHMAMVTVASDTINRLIEDGSLDEAYSYAQYVEAFFRALREKLPPPPQDGSYAPDHSHHNYREGDFFTLMKGGISPEQAAESALQDLSAERAVQAATLPRSVAEGVL